MVKPAGYYHHVVDVMQNIESQQAKTGAIKQTPQLFKADQFARVTALSASEQLKATGQVQVGLYRVEMHFRNDINASNYFVWKIAGLTLKITGVVPSPTTNEMEFLCASVT